MRLGKLQQDISVELILGLMGGPSAFDAPVVAVGVGCGDVGIQPTPQLALRFNVRIDQGGDEVISLARFAWEPAPPSAIAGSSRFHASCQLPGLVFGLAFAGARAVETNNDLAALLGKKLQSRHESVAATFLMPAIDAIHSHCDLADGAGRHGLQC